MKNNDPKNKIGVRGQGSAARPELPVTLISCCWPSSLLTHEFEWITVKRWEESHSRCVHCVLCYYSSLLLYQASETLLFGPQAETDLTPALCAKCSCQELCRSGWCSQCSSSCWEAFQMAAAAQKKHKNTNKSWRANKTAAESHTHRFVFIYFFCLKQQQLLALAGWEATVRWWQ